MSDLERVERLTLRALDGEASEAETEELAALVATDPEAFERHRELLDLEVVLRGEEAPADLAQGTMDRVRRAQADRVSAGVMDRLRKRDSGADPEPALSAVDAVERDPGADSAPDPDAEPAPARSRRGPRLAMAAAAVLALGATLIAGYQLGRRDAEHLPEGPPPPAAAPDPATQARLERAEREVKNLREQIAAQKARQDESQKRVRETGERTRNAIASLRKELDRFVATERDPSAPRGRASASHPSHVASARARLRALTQLRDKVRALQKQAPRPQLQILQRLLAEIAQHVRAVRSVLRIARGAPRMRRMRRPAHRKRAQPGHRPRGSRRAAAAFDEPFSD